MALPWYYVQNKVVNVKNMPLQWYNVQNTMVKDQKPWYYPGTMYKIPWYIIYI